MVTLHSKEYCQKTVIQIFSNPDVVNIAIEAHSTVTVTVYSNQQ